MEKIQSSGWDEVSYMWWDRYENRIEYFPCPMPESWKQDMRGAQIESSRLRAIDKYSKKLNCVCRGNMVNYLKEYDARNAVILFWKDKLEKPLEQYMIDFVNGKLQGV